MAIVTNKAVEVYFNREYQIIDKGIFGIPKENTIRTKELAKIGTYYVLCKDDNDETLQSIIDSIIRIHIGIGTKFDELAQRALEAQPEYISNDLYNESWLRGSCKINGVYYKIVAENYDLYFIPLYYWMYKGRDTIPCDVTGLDNGNITKELKDFIDRLKNTYSKYVELYETRKEE